jgi:hypothetical protein
MLPFMPHSPECQFCYLSNIKRRGNYICFSCNATVAFPENTALSKPALKYLRKMPNMGKIVYNVTPLHAFFPTKYKLGLMPCPFNMHHTKLSVNPHRNVDISLRAYLAVKRNHCQCIRSQFRTAEGLFMSMFVVYLSEFIYFISIALNRTLTRFMEIVFSHTSLAL